MLKTLRLAVLEENKLGDILEVAVERMCVYVGGGGGGGGGGRRRIQ